MPFEIGDKVKLAVSNPNHGLGSTSVLSEMGTIASSHGEQSWRVDFPSHKSFYADDSDLAHVKEGEIITPPPKSLHSSSPPKIDIETDKIIRQWELDKTLSLATLAADFYTLIYIQCDFPNEPPVNEALEKITKLLATQFSAYLDMVIGGELRYAEGNIVDENSRYSENYGSIEGMPISETGKDILRSMGGYDGYAGRTPVWEGWQVIRKKLGLSALEVAKQIFNLKWKDGYGGESWANATRILLDYLEHKLPAQAFVDTCFGLHHNNNIILDKVWVVNKALKNVLNYNKENQMNDVVAYCSPSIQNLKWKVCGE